MVSCGQKEREKASYFIRTCIHIYPDLEMNIRLLLMNMEEDISSIPVSLSSLTRVPRRVEGCCRLWVSDPNSNQIRLKCRLLYGFSFNAKDLESM